MAAALSLVAVVPVVAAAQPSHRIVLTPYIGAYLPSADVGGFSMTEQGTAVRAKIAHKNTLAFGGTGSYWLNDRWALELGAAYSPSDVKVTAGAPIEGGTFSMSDKEHANLWLGSAKAMVNLLPSTSNWRLRFGFGPAVISRGGKAFKEDAEGKVTGKTNYGGAFSLCTRVPVTGPFAIRLRAEDYLYQTNFKFVDKVDPTASFNLGRKTQNDFVLSAGLQFGFQP